MDGTLNYLVFQPLYNYFKVITNTDYVSSWKSKELSAKSIKPLTTSDNSFTPALSSYGAKTGAKFVGSCLKQPKISFTHGKVENIYIVYELCASSSHNNDPTLKKLFILMQLLWLKILILISKGTLLMELDLVEDQPFHYLMVLDLVKM